MWGSSGRTCFILKYGHLNAVETMIIFNLCVQGNVNSFFCLVLTTSFDLLITVLHLNKGLYLCQPAWSLFYCWSAQSIVLQYVAVGIVDWQWNAFLCIALRSKLYLPLAFPVESSLDLLFISPRPLFALWLSLLKQ